MRVLFDTNVWLAVLTTDGFCRYVWRTARASCTFCGSDDILSEIREKLRAKFGFSVRHAGLLTLFVGQQIELVHVISVLKVCADPDDDRIIAAALDGGCSVLVTGDAALLPLKRFQTVDVVTPRQFGEYVSMR